MEVHDIHHADKIKTLLERYEEEIEDAEEYEELAEEMPGCAKLFRTIGNEEVTHAYHLRDKLLKMGHEFAGEHESKWHKVLKEYGWEK